MIFSSRLKEMLETFRVCDLKSLLDKYNLSHSGTKAALFNRLISFLCKLRTVEEQTEFIQRVDDLYFTRERSLKTRGRARAVARPKSYLELFYPHENYEVSFSLSPFHRFIRSIHQFASDDHSTLHIVKEFSFSQLDRLLLYAQARTARADSRHLPFLKVLLLTAPVHRDNTCPLRIQYPNCFIIEVNEHVIQRTCKKKGAMDVPLDISGYVRLDHVNLLRIHLLTRERLHVQICLAEYSSPSKLLHKLYSEKFIPANVLFSEWSAHLSRANDEELQVESSGLSLLSPLTLSRITTPCRSLGCRHLQCFDALDYLSLNEKCPSWICPLCNQPADFDSLVVDGYFLSLLVGAPPDVKEMVITYTDGLNWEIAYKDNRKRPRDHIGKDHQQYEEGDYCLVEDDNTTCKGLRRKNTRRNDPKRSGFSVHHLLSVGSSDSEEEFSNSEPHIFQNGSNKNISRAPSTGLGVALFNAAGKETDKLSL